MEWLRARARSYWRALRRPDRLWSEMDEEMRFHVEMEAERLVREGGLERDEALRQAAVAFGGMEKYKEAGREARGLTWLTGLSLDVKLAWRLLKKSRGLAAVCVLGLAIGTAVSVGFFVVFTTTLYPRVPLEEGDRLVALENWDVEANREAPRSLHDFVTWREEMRTVEQLSAAALDHRQLVTGDTPPQPVRAAEMTAAGFQVARVPPLLGRYIVPDDEQAGAPRVAVLGYDLWHSRFEGDPRTIGRSVLLGDAEHVIIGVMPPGFAFPRNQEIWTPLRLSATGPARGEGPELFVFGRLAPGFTRAQAQAEVAALGRQAAAAFPETNARLRPQVLPYTYPLENTRAFRLADAARLQLLVTLLLVAVAVNIAVLVYARTAMRQAEIAVRTALGASRRRIVGQLFIEALLLAGLGAGLGLLLAHLGLQQMESLANPDGAAFWVDHGLRPESAAFALFLAVLSATIVGVVPALASTGRRLDHDLRRLGTGASVRIGRAWTAMIIAQVAIAVTALPTAVHLGVREIRMASVQSTFPAHEFLIAGVGLSTPIRPGMDAETYRRETAARMVDRLPELEARLEAEPNVAGVTFEANLRDRGSLLEVEGTTLHPWGRPYHVPSTGVATDYFDVLGARILAGRGFRQSDAGSSGEGLIVTESFVRRVLGEGPAVGRRLRFGPHAREGASGSQDPGAWLEIVGVVEDLYASRLDRDAGLAAVYYAVGPAEIEAASLLVRVRDGDPGGITPRLRQLTAAVDPDLRLGWVDILSTVRNPRYLAATVSVLLLVLGSVLLLSAAGIHALTSLTVTRRRREIGIRTALGAHPARLLASIFARVARQLGAGGLLGSLLGGALLVSHGVAAGRVAILLSGVVLLMIAAGLLAAMGPARRGLRIQPMEALREE